MTQNNNCMSLYGFAFVISVLRRISFDITSQKIRIVFVKKHCELSCCTIAITLLSSPWVCGYHDYLQKALENTEGPRRKSERERDVLVIWVNYLSTLYARNIDQIVQ